MHSNANRSPFRPWLAAAAALVLLLPAIGCGKKAGEAPNGTEADAPAAVAAPASPGAPAVEKRAEVPLGAESPEALVERMRKAAEEKNVRELAACMEPESRRQMAEGMFLGASMMVAFSGMAEGMGEMAGEMAGAVAGAVGGEEAAADAKEKVAAGTEAAGVNAAGMAERFNALLARHGLPTLDDESDGGKEMFDKALANADQVALIGDIGDFLEAEMDESEDSGEKSPVPVGELADLAIDGDRATARIGEEAVEFVRIDGRWFFKEPSKPGI